MAEIKDPHLHIEFFADARMDPRASEEAGRPMFRDVEMVRIRFAGDRRREHVAPAHEPFQMERGSGRHMTYAERFRDHYEAFKRDAAAAVTGTPIRMMPGLTPSKLRELEAAAITTVEALAALPDRIIGKMGMGARDLTERARAFLEQADQSAAVSAAQAENADLRERLARLESLMSSPPQVEPFEADDPASWDDDALRAYLTERGASPRANAARDKMIEAVRAFMADEQVAA